MNNLQELIDREFPVITNTIYLNHAGVGPWPRRTAEAVSHFATECAQTGAQAYPRWMALETGLRGRLKAFINAPSVSDIAILKNTSEGLSVVAHGFPWKRGDNVVSGNEEFPSNRIVWQSLAPQGVKLRQVDLQSNGDPEAALLAACDSRTRLLAVSSVEYATGLRLDLLRLGAECRKRGIAFCVDAIQGLGVFPHDVQAMGIDFLAADAHKWLLAPEGTAVFYCAPAWRERLILRQFGWHMVEEVGNFDRTDWTPANSARRFECGSPNMLGIHALAASLSLFEEIGVETIEQRVLDRSRDLMDRIRAIRALRLVTPHAAGRFAGIVTFRIDSIAPDEAYRALTESGVICAARAGGIRFSPHFFTPLDQLDRALHIVNTFTQLNK